MINKSNNKLINELVVDCITHKLTETEALDYIKQRYGKEIGIASYKRRKAHIKSDTSTNLWLNDYTRIGYVKSHQEDIEIIRRLRDDSMRRLLLETNKRDRDEYKIFKLKDNIIETTKLLSELNLGTPIISAIKNKLEQKAKGNESIQTR